MNNENIQKKMQILLNNKNYNIFEYDKIYEDFSEDWYDKFIQERIKAKQIEGFNPNLSNEMILFLQNERDFLNYFKDFMKLKNKTDFYVNIENNILNHTRINNNNFKLGEPTLDKDIRKQNYEYTLNLGKNCDNMYTLIYEYLNFIENLNTSYSFNNFILLKTL